MVEKLESTDQRKNFYIIIFLSLIVIFCLRYFVIPFIIGDGIVLDHKTVYDVLDKLFTSTIVTISLGGFLFWLTPKNKLNAQIKILQPIEIGSAFEHARYETEKWWFSGGSGKFTRSVTLPTLSTMARNKNKSIEIVVQIMNPHNSAVCKSYVSYRNGLRSGKYNKKTLKSVQVDLISTIVSVYTWKSEQALLNIQLGLRDNFSLFRIDISSNKAIITKEDPLEPAILYDNGTFFYEAYCEEIKQSYSQIKKLDTNIAFVGLEEINEQNIKELLMKLNLYELVEDKDLKTIIENVKTTENPYG